MAESNNLLYFDVNENVAKSCSNSNELCFTSAESGILNLSSEISNHVFQQLEDVSFESNCPQTLNKNFMGTENLDGIICNNVHGDVTSNFSGNESSLATTSPTRDNSSLNLLDESMSNQISVTTGNNGTSSESDCLTVTKDTPAQDCSQHNTAEKMFIAEESKNSLSHENSADCLSKANGQSVSMRAESNSSDNFSMKNLETKYPDAQTSCQDLVDEYLPSTQNSLPHHFGQNLMGDAFSSVELNAMLQAPSGYNFPSESFTSHEESVCNEASNSDLLKSGTIDFSCNETIEGGYIPLQSTASSSDAVFSDLSLKPEEKIDNLEMSDHDKSATDYSVPADVLEEDPFTVPSTANDNDEEFTDAVQFFKDPSSLQFLEDIQTSVPSECRIPRSSLYTTFDPLLTKFPPGQQGKPETFLESSGKTDSPVLGEVDDSQKAPVQMPAYDVSVRESTGNILLSFDSPQVGNKIDEPEVDSVSPVVPRLYTEEELQQALKVNELQMQEAYLKQHRETEEEMKKLAQDKDSKVSKLSNLCQTQQLAIKELTDVAEYISTKNKEMKERVEILDKENKSLKEEVKRADNDLLSVETTFSDFHKRYETSKEMLKSYKKNEEVLAKEMENCKSKLDEQTQMYNTLQEQTQEILEKSNAEVASIKKSNDALVAVLKAQLKKAELKISSLESDIKQMRIENSKLGGICDDLMAKVRET